MSDDDIDEHRFQQAFAAVDPEPLLLLQILIEDPIETTVHDLAFYYTEAVEENPSRGPYLASVLVKVANSPDAPTFPSDTVSSCLNRALADQHFKTFYGDSRVKEYGPKNTYLLESLLSGLSFKYDLTSTSDMLGTLCDGLDTPHGSSDSPEVSVIGTCIQLLIHGSEVTERAAGSSYHMSPEEIASKLKAHKAAGIVKDPHALQVLDLTISLAETGFQPENDREDVWDLLFPPKA
ncbi:hypothetical protein CPB84DRAFT_1745992 [Gymnopilus junonius]|uniref:Uncharacterized protein n=1 Tax=Gymnopilus junonius TaxID=109634 RepID=A0A9P5NTD8_GYMJU|nr:hypothetical protein CPB84DRAFT_1745992 [Gymnopilus junonius]